MIPVSLPSVGEREIELVSDAVRSGWVSSAGSYIEDFERSFSEYHGAGHCVALSNGTAALEVALHAAGVGKGDEVIIPSFTIMSVAIAVVRIGAIPRVVDVHSDSWNLTAETAREAITLRSRAIIVVHSFGHPADMDPIIELAKLHGLKVIEDVAESIGSSYKGKLCGTFGDVAAFSFYANKLVTTGEGGAIITNNKEIAGRARRYINLYFGNVERFSHDEIGYNFRMTNMQAALGCAQMEKIDHFVKLKKEIGFWYQDALESCDTVQFQKTIGPVDHVYWMYSVVLRDHVQMDAMAAMEYLKSCGIDTRPMFKGLHQQVPLQPYFDESALECPVSEHLYLRAFYVPSAVTLTRDQVITVVEALKKLK